jgi:hypothetical protein
LAPYPRQVFFFPRTTETKTTLDCFHSKATFFSGHSNKQESSSSNGFPFHQNIKTRIQYFYFIFVEFKIRISVNETRTFGLTSERAFGSPSKALLRRSRTALAADDVFATKRGKLLALEDAPYFRLVRFDLQYNPTKSTNMRPSLDARIEGGGLEAARVLEWRS